MKEKKHESIFSQISLHSIPLIVGGALLFSVSLNTLITPCGLFNGGFLGISQLLRSLIVFLVPSLESLDLDISGIFYFGMNIPLLLWAASKFGKPFFLKTALCVSLYSLFLTLIPVPETPFVADRLTSCLIAGLLCGSGIGLTLLAGGSGGGEEILGLAVSRKFPNITVGNIAMGINVFIFGSCFLLFDLATVIYSALFAAFTYFAMDKVHFQNIMTTMMIITKKPDMEQEIFRTVHRGVTKWEGCGGFKKEPAEVLVTVISKKEALALKSVLQTYDPDCFIIVNEDISVHGNFQVRL